jgi:Zn-dependent M28 family amino/carboxypeptidase
MPAVFLAIILQFTPQEAKLSFDTAQRLVENFTPRDAGTAGGRIAAKWLAFSLKSLGVKNVQEDVFSADSPLGKMRFTNVVAEFKHSNTSKWTVLLSHYDTKRSIKCPGANDGASTSALLVGLSKMLSGAKGLKKNYLLIWTDAEECIYDYSANDGLQGSKRAVEYVKSRYYDVENVICLDMLGDKDLKIEIPSNGSGRLTRTVIRAAKKIGEKNLVSLSPYHVIDDHAPFLKAGYEAIDLIDFSYGSAPGLNDYWHTENDVMKNISVDSLLKSGSLIAAVIEDIERL